MQKIKNLDMISGGRVEPVIESDNRLYVKDGSELYKVIDNRTNRIIAYFPSYYEAVNFDRYYHDGFPLQYNIGPNGLYVEEDCFETTADPNIQYKK